MFLISKKKKSSRHSETADVLAKYRQQNLYHDNKFKLHEMQKQCDHLINGDHNGYLSGFQSAAGKILAKYNDDLQALDAKGIEVELSIGHLYEKKMHVVAFVKESHVVVYPKQFIGENKQIVWDNRLEQIPVKPQ